MRAYTEFTTDLSRLLAEAQAPPERRGLGLSSRLDFALDGQASLRLREAVPINVLRKKGAFFSSSRLAEFALSGIACDLSASSRIYDPACGAGNLLLECAKRLPIAGSVRETSELWGRCLFGVDTQEEFVHAARLRLAILALRAHELPTSRMRWDTKFSGVRVGFGDQELRLLQSASHVVMNPPFTRTKVSNDCRWRSGSANKAALFVEYCLENASQGTKLVAILPDVLRSGSSYSEWRKRVTERLRIEAVRVFGRFDQSTDIDVFVLEGTTSSTEAKVAESHWGLSATGSTCIGDLFRVSVGAVVDYRDKRTGQMRAFATPKNMPAWKVVGIPVEYRQTNRPTVSPPFLVVRRTSSPADKCRAVATLVTGRGQVAVENHLLVLRPKDGLRSTCQAALNVLQREATTRWLNDRIRCRHLTVDAVAGIPWDLT